MNHNRQFFNNCLSIVFALFFVCASKAKDAILHTMKEIIEDFMSLERGMYDVYQANVHTLLHSPHDTNSTFPLLKEQKNAFSKVFYQCPILAKNEAYIYFNMFMFYIKLLIKYKKSTEYSLLECDLLFE